MSTIPSRALVRSEWIKLRSLRSTGITLSALVVVGIAFGVISALSANASWDSLSIADRATFDPTEMSFYGLYIAQLAVGVLGALAICAEFSTGTIRTTLLLTPQRRRVLAVKALVFGGVALVVGEITALVSFEVTQALFVSPVPQASLADPQVLRAVILSGAYVALVGLLALGLGVIIRNTAGAIAAFVGVVLLISFLVAPLPETVVNAVMPYTPGGILTTFMTPVAPPPHSLDPWVALGVLIGEVAVIWVVAVALFDRRDA